MTSTRLIAGSVVASVAWAAAFALGVRLDVLAPVLAVLAAVVAGCVLVLVPPVRRRLAPRARDLAVGVGAGAVSLAATYALYPLARAFVPGLADDVRALYALLPFSPAAAALIVAVVIAEELLWRGALLPALRVSHPVLAAALLSSTIYAAAQLGLGVPVVGAVAFVLGVLWALEAALTDGLVAPLVSHALWTITVLARPLEHA